MKTSLLLPVLALALGSVASASGGAGVEPLFDGFDGSNQGGWSYNSGDVLENTGGNPGG